MFLLCRDNTRRTVAGLHGAAQKINPEQTLGTRLEDVAEDDHKRVLLRAQNTV
jgi:hypothetical protein